MISYWIIRNNYSITKENGRTGREVFLDGYGWVAELETDESTAFPVTDLDVI